ncbi:sulfotransferase family protein [Microlunatus soli]|uniref:Sulfotransferase family protein n=1 Tax=Microlunatus soli TaxID=630515 RepID=A0A1H1RUZ8_9ACTN|nr:hypothetical protein [Microlunatus soli]SDS39518.1 hypothetical protein SAMN04489812_1779 [Microlunatus soli]
MPETTLAAETELPKTSTRLLMVTGPGRSGTSAVTGALSQLGVHVPPPLVDWNKSNRKGFFETRWVVDFQREVLKAAHTYEFDADPRAAARIADATDAATQEELSRWLHGAAAGHRQLVIKDPRSVWLHDLWERAATDSGLTLCFLTMLRHPTEVVGSRSTYYGTAKDPRKARDYAISKVAGWINVSLLNERQTRGRPRAYLRYTDLLADWRSALTGVRDAVGLELNADLSSGEPSPVDEFISPELHRIRTGWDELDVPDELRTIAEQTWDACCRLADEGGDTDLSTEFDDLSERYARSYRDAAAIASDTIDSAVARAAAESARKVRQEFEDRLRESEQASGSRLFEMKAAGAAGAKATVTRARRLSKRVVRRVRRRLDR